MSTFLNPNAIPDGSISKDKLGFEISEGGGGLETRILYVPKMTTEGSELTAEEKAYNLETANKILAGTARAAISMSGTINLTTTYAINMAMFDAEGILIAFDNDFAFGFGFVIGTDGDILLTFPISSILIIEEALSNTDFTAIGMGLYYHYMGGTPPKIYLLESKYNNFIPCSLIKVLAGTFYILKFIYYASGSKHIATLTVYEEDETFNISICPDRVYINSSSSLDLESNRNWWNNRSNVDGNKTPSVVYSDSYRYSPLCVNIGEEYADFTIYRDNALEVWRILASDGTASLISTSQLQFVTTE